MTKKDYTITKNSNEALKYTWGKYREYAATSRSTKAQLTNWRNRVLILSAGGAVFGVLCQESIRLELDKYWEHIPTVLGFLSSLLLAIAAYFGKELVKPETERAWIRARSMAEAFKSNSFLYATSTTPYENSNSAQLLLNNTNEQLNKAKDLPTVEIDDHKRLERLLPDKIDIKQYLSIRVDDQINFYNKKVQDYKKKMKSIKNIGLVLGFIAVVFGVLGSTTGWTAGWIAVISTITSSIAAFAFANRYQYLIISYKATGNRLEILKTGWKAAGLTDEDKTEKQDFIKKCEEAISVENSGWMAEYIK